MNDGPERDTENPSSPQGGKENGSSPGRHVVFHTAPLSLNGVAWCYEAESRSEMGEGKVGHGSQLTHDEDDTKSFELDW